MRHVPILLAILVAVGSAAPALGEHCTTWSTRDFVYADTAPASEATGQPRYYVDSDCFAFVVCPWQTFSLWIYEESNGIPGLQRGDEEIDDTCHSMIEADRIIL